MFTDKKYSTSGKRGEGVSVSDAADYLFDELVNYLDPDGREMDIEGLGLSQYHGSLWETLGVTTRTPDGKEHLAVEKETFKQIMYGVDPSTQHPFKQWKKERAPGSEILLAPDGDVSLFYSRASLEEKIIIRKLYDEAVNETMTFLEKEVCKIRVAGTDEYGNKVEKHITPNGGVGFMRFDHFESRMVQKLVDEGKQDRPDCVLHSHISHPNLAVHNGEVYALENRYLKEAQTQADMVFKNRLYNDMSRAFGLKFSRELVEQKSYQKRSKESFRFKIDGFTDQERAVHGTRSKELEKEVECYMAKKIRDEEEFYKSQGKPVPASVYNQKLDPNIEKGISTNMRAAKADFSQRELVEKWEAEWDEKGFTHDKLTEIMERGKALDLQDRFEKVPTAEQIMDLLTAKKQSFKMKEFRDLYLQHHAGTGKSFEQLKEEIHVALAEHGVELKAEKTKGRQLQGDDFNTVFTSKKLHHAEKSALAWVKENKDRKSQITITHKDAIAGINEWEKLKSIELGKPVKLNREQRRAAIAMCTGKGGIVCAISGEAGTGKTFAIQAATHCLSKKNFTQVGSAVSGRAAENLSVEGLGGAEAVSVAAFLTRFDAEKKLGRKVELPQILWLDEAATTNSEQLAKILEIGQKSNADFRVICTYDFKQTQAIGPTGLLLDIVKEVGEQKLVEVKRQKTAEALAVAKLARDGNLTELKQHMKNQTRFDGGGAWYSVRDSRANQIAELTDLYMKNPNGATDKLVVGLLRKDIEELNQSIREARIAKGEIKVGRQVRCSYKDEDSALAIGQSFRQEKVRNFSEGDRIIIKEGFKIAVGKDAEGKPIKEHLLTGYAGTIIEQNPHDDYMKVRFDNGKVVAWDFSKDKQNTVDHFYAGTVNSTQGASVKWCAGMDAAFGTAVQEADKLSTGEKNEIEELGKNRNLLYTMLSRHGYEANFITTEALDKTFEQRYGAYGLEESTINKVVQPQPTVQAANENEWGLIDLSEHQKQQPVTQPVVQQPKEKQHGTNNQSHHRQQQVIPEAIRRRGVRLMSSRNVDGDTGYALMPLSSELRSLVEVRNDSEAGRGNFVLRTNQGPVQPESATVIPSQVQTITEENGMEKTPLAASNENKVPVPSLGELKTDKPKVPEVRRTRGMGMAR